MHQKSAPATPQRMTFIAAGVTWCDWLRRIIPLNAHKKAQHNDASSGGEKPYNKSTGC
jgi:hypothetical protein